MSIFGIDAPLKHRAKLYLHRCYRARFTSFHNHAQGASVLTVFVCFFVLLHSCCSHARVWENTRA